jgi:hypothetical protein
MAFNQVTGADDEVRPEQDNLGQNLLEDFGPSAAGPVTEHRESEGTARSRTDRGRREQDDKQRSSHN